MLLYFDFVSRWDEVPQHNNMLDCIRVIGQHTCFMVSKSQLMSFVLKKSLHKIELVLLIRWCEFILTKYSNSQVHTIRDIFFKIMLEASWGVEGYPSSFSCTLCSILPNFIAKITINDIHTNHLPFFLPPFLLHVSSGSFDDNNIFCIIVCQHR